MSFFLFYFTNLLCKNVNKKVKRLIDLCTLLCSYVDCWSLTYMAPWPHKKIISTSKWWSSHLLFLKLLVRNSSSSCWKYMLFILTYKSMNPICTSQNIWACNWICSLLLKKGIAGRWEVKREENNGKELGKENTRADSLRKYMLFFMLEIVLFLCWLSSW